MPGGPGLKPLRSGCELHRRRPTAKIGSLTFELGSHLLLHSAAGHLNLAATFYYTQQLSGHKLHDSDTLAEPRGQDARTLQL